MSETTLKGTVLNVLYRWQKEGPLWTSDIAHGARLPTSLTRRCLVALEKEGKAKRVATGNPTSWIGLFDSQDPRA